MALVRNRPQPEFTNEAITRIFQLDPTKLPVYVGTAGEGGGFSIYRLVKVIAPPEVDPEKVAAARARIGEMQNRELFDAYVNTLKAKAKVEINQANLEKSRIARARGGPRRRSGRRALRCSVVSGCSGSSGGSVVEPLPLRAGARHRPSPRARPVGFVV